MTKHDLYHLAKEKRLQSPDSVSQCRAERIDLELKGSKFITGTIKFN
jgi:hypothetical protein